MNFDFNKKNLVLIFILVGLILLSIFLINKDNNSNNTNVKKNDKVSIVKNYNNFYTVNSCVYRYLTYLQANDIDSLLKVLDEDFISSNSINSSNLFNFLVSYDGNVSFNSRKMYEEKVNSNVMKYYVYGYVEKDIMDSFPEQTDAYFIVKLDSKNKVFSIMPYSGEIFK